MCDEKKEHGNPETCEGGPATCSPEEMKKCGCAPYFELKRKEKDDQ